MNMKCISAFVVITTLLSPEHIQAVPVHKTQTIFRSLMHRIGSDIESAQGPFIQKRGIITPHEYTNLYTIFKPKYAHLSPLTGVALYQNFASIYQFGSTKSAFTRLLNNPNIGFFHYVDDVLHPTRNKTIPASSWDPEFLGALAADIHLNNIHDSLWQKEFIQQCKISHIKAFGEKEQVKTWRINLVAQTLAESSKELTDTQDRVALYPRYYLTAVPAAMLMRKAKTKHNEIVSYIRSLDKQMQFRGAESPLRESAYADLERCNMFTDVDFRQALTMSKTALGLTDEAYFEKRFAAEADALSTGSLIPQKVIMHSYGYHDASSAPDCSEAALRDLCNLILAGSDSNFDLSYLPSTIHPHKTLKAFYDRYKSYSSINEYEVGQAWMNLISGHKEIQYCSSVNRKRTKEYELYSCLDNFLRVLNILFGTTAKTYPEFGQQISSPKRGINAELISKNKVRCTITYDTTDFTAHVCVEPGIHAKLETQDRESKDGIFFDATTDNFVKILKKSKSAQEIFETELLIALYRIKPWFMQNFSVKTVAQASHLAFARSGTFYSFSHRLVQNNPLEKQIAMLNTILTYTEDAPDETPTGQIILREAVKLKDLELVKYLLQLGISPNIPGIWADIPLTYAIRNGHKEMCRLLIEHGADVNAQCGPPLKIAIEKKDLSICRLLIEHGADVNGRDGLKNTRLIQAVENKDLAVCTLLIEHGADIDIRNCSGNTALLTAVMTQDAEICKLLIKNGADMHIKNSTNRTPLESAQYFKFTKIYQLLSEYKPNKTPVS